MKPPAGLDINLLDQPLRIHERPTISLSLIDEHHLKTFGDVGLILKVPNSALLATSPQDCGTCHSRPDLVRGRARELGIRSASELLQDSWPNCYNEIIACGTSDTGEKLRVVGFFIKTIHGKSVAKGLEGLIRTQALELKLPLVELNEPGAFDGPNFVTVDGGRPRVVYNGNCYQIYEGKFEAYDALTIKYLPSPEEMKTVLDFIVSRDTIGGDDLRDRFSVAHNLASIQHYLPRVERYSDKTIGGIVFTVPSKSGDRRVHIRASGFTEECLWSTYLENYQKQSASASQGSIESSSLPVVAAEVAENHLNEFISKSEEPLRTELQRFKEISLPAINKFLSNRYTATRDLIRAPSLPPLKAPPVWSHPSGPPQHFFNKISNGLGTKKFFNSSNLLNVFRLSRN